MPQLSVICPDCLQLNDIHVAEVPVRVGICCSHCHSRLGTWSSLQKGVLW